MMRVSALALCASLSGCAIFSPYDSKFMCEATDDYGRCMDVDGAYNEALGGNSSNGLARMSRKKPTEDEQAQIDAHRLAQESASYSAYKQAEYREMQKLLDQPVTPLIKPPKVLRTLITAYPSSERTLYTPRYVFFFADEGRFVLGDYLNTPQASSAQSLEPFSGE